ncbi:integrase, catalytic region, zinc finger, CCHC-type containing protein [Tanacetum coccineum]
MHMLAPKPSSYYTGLGKNSFANSLYLKQAQKEKLCLFNVKYDKNDLAKLFAPESDETLRLAEESRSRLCKTMVQPYDYTKQNSLYELFTPQTKKSREQLLFDNEIVQIILIIIDSRCTKHMTGNLKLLCNFVEKYLGTVRFRNDQFGPILGYEDLVQGNITIKMVYYVECLNHNLFSGNDLLTGNRGSDLYTISLQETSAQTPICFMAKASPTQAWLWHRRLSHLNFDTINLLSKKDIVNGLPKLNMTRINCVDLVNWNSVVERRNRTLVEAARTMLSASKLPLFFWVEAIATACYTQNRSLIIPKHEKTPYHIIHNREPSLKHLHSFGCTCYITRDRENLDKMKEKVDPCILVGYSTQSKTSDHNNSKLRIQDHNNEPSSSKLVDMSLCIADKTNTSLQELNLLLSPMYKEYFTAGNQIVSKSSALSDNLQQQDTQPTLNVQPTLEPITPPTNVNAEENNIDQAGDAQFEPYEFINPFCTPVQEVVESSSSNIDTSNMHTFYQRHRSDYH